MYGLDRFKYIIFNGRYANADQFLDFILDERRVMSIKVSFSHHIIIPRINHQKNGSEERRSKEEEEGGGTEARKREIESKLE